MNLGAGGGGGGTSLGPKTGTGVTWGGGLTKFSLDGGPPWKKKTLCSSAQVVFISHKRTN